MTSVNTKCEESSGETNIKAARYPDHDVFVEANTNKGRVLKTGKMSVILIMAAVIIVLVTAMLNRSLPRGAAPRAAIAIQTTHLNGNNGAARHQHTTRRVSAATRVTATLDPTRLLFDLKTVVDQSPETVAQVLGESPVLWPDERSFSGTLTGKYKRGKIHIGYAGEGARFITIFFSRCKRWTPTASNSKRCIESDDFTNYRYQQDIPDLLQALGLPKEKRPSLNNTAVVSWREASGIHQVSVFPNGLGGINHIQVISNRYYACLLERAEVECKSH